MSMLTYATSTLYSHESFTNILSLPLTQFNSINVTVGDAHVIIVDGEQKRVRKQSRLPVMDRWF